MKTNKLSICKSIVKENYQKVIDILYKEDEIIPMYIVNHIYRICLQKHDINNIKLCLERVLETQLDSGGWSFDGGSENEGIYGITATETQLLFWTLAILKGEVDVEKIKHSIDKGIKFLLEGYDKRGFWTEKVKSKRNHGILDLNHYILQSLFYASSDKTGEFMYKELCNKIGDLTDFYKETQTNDGGWHEIGKIRTRVGTTADAVRALLPRKEVKTIIQKGIDFLVDNQHPYEGYWCGGDHDKCYDALKAIINSLWIIEKSPRYINAIEIGIDYILSFELEELNLEELCDLYSVILDYIYMKENAYYVEKYYF